MLVNQTCKLIELCEQLEEEISKPTSLSYHECFHRKSIQGDLQMIISNYKEILKSKLL